MISKALPKCTRRNQTECRVSSWPQAHADAATEDRLALRLTLADSNASCGVVIYHDALLPLMQKLMPEVPQMQDTPALRQALLAMFRSAQWLCRFTFRGNEYQEILELDLRYMQPCLLTAGTFDPDPLLLQRTVPHCHLNSGCPVVPLKAVQVDRHLGLLSFAAIQANSIRALVALNAVELPDDETLQQEPATTSAMRVKRSVDCLLSGLANDSDVPFRVKLRCAGPASAVNWMLRGQAGQVFQVVLGQADSPGEWSVLWHVLVAPEHVDAWRSYWQHLSGTECKKSPSTVKYDSTWTPNKRVCYLRDNMPAESRESAAWQTSASQSAA